MSNYLFDTKIISQNQIGQEFTINYNIKRLGQIVHLLVLSKKLTTPPSVVNDNDIYIIAENASSIWQGKSGEIAIYNTNSGWEFLSPKDGMFCYIKDEDLFYYYKESEWSVLNNNSSSGSSSANECTFDVQKIVGDGLLFDSINSKIYFDKSLIPIIPTIPDPSVVIDDSKVSGVKNTYSIDKIKSLIPVVSNPIDDSVASSASKTYSVDKIKSLIPIIPTIPDPSVVIDDSKVSGVKNTYSIDKILATINAAFANIQNNSNTFTSSTSAFTAGDYKYSAISNDHHNWLKCDGRIISRTTYSKLFAVIGTSFGTGDGSTTFNLPDFRGRVAGSIEQGVGLSSRSLGQATGSETHTLSVNEIPPHRPKLYGANSGGNAGVRSASLIVNGMAVTANYLGQTNDCTNAMDMIGGGQPHNNMQPTLFAGSVFICTG
ncbi:MAG: hypothetical protein RL208_672 [Pseudomonadota bacterium]|jgi:microcystin-dependent protein